MKDWFKKVNDYIKDGIPLIVLISWLCMVVFVIKILMIPIRQ